MLNELWSYAEISGSPRNLAEISIMAATERNEVILSKGDSLQYTKLLKDKINAVCHIEVVIEDSKSRKRRQG